MRVHRISFILRGPSSNNSAPPKTIRSHHGFFHCYREISSISSVSFYNLGKSRRHSRRIPPWELELLAYIHRIYSKSQGIDSSIFEERHWVFIAKYFFPHFPTVLRRWSRGVHFGEPENRKKKLIISGDLFFVETF